MITPDIQIVYKADEPLVYKVNGKVDEMFDENGWGDLWKVEFEQLSEWRVKLVRTPYGKVRVVYHLHNV